jgi:NADPH-dependent 2,4-dienoyl-CoA reductase/sulfur reductase-like enzyme
MSEQVERFGVVVDSSDRGAAALTMNGKKVTMLFPEEGIGVRIFPRELSLHLNDFFREKGVKVIAGENVKDLKKSKDSYYLITAQGHQVQVDGVIAGMGYCRMLSLPNLPELRSATGSLWTKCCAQTTPKSMLRGM